MKPRQTKKPGALRIIGGGFRGQKIPCLDLPELRPTPNRVRETLFNWLAPCIGGANCLDLFAGTGALGFEALSRGAKTIVMIEKSKSIARQLYESSDKLKATGVTIIQAELPEGLDSLKKASSPPLLPFDIVFLDPPFNQNLIGPCCKILDSGGFLTPDAWIYIEAEQSLTSLPIPSHWKILQNKRAGQVRYYLVHLDVDANAKDTNKE